MDEIKEYGGFKLGDKVRLVGDCLPDDVGKITKIKVDSSSVRDGFDGMSFKVLLKNSADHNEKSEWWPIYVDGMVKV